MRSSGAYFRQVNVDIAVVISAVIKLGKDRVDIVIALPFNDNVGYSYVIICFKSELLNG